MSEELESIHQSLIQFIKQFYQKEIIIHGLVKEIRPDCFVLIVQNTLFEVECYTSLSIENLTVYLPLMAKGFLELAPHSTTIRMRIVEFCPVSESNKYSIAKTNYDKYKTLLSNDKYVSCIQKMNTKNPTSINRIGLIAIQGSALDHFVRYFGEVGMGTLCIYKLSPDNLGRSLIESMEYFRKMNRVDAIVVLTSSFTQNQTYEICCADVIRYLLRTIKTQYIMSVEDQLTDTSLVHLFSSRVAATNEAAIEDIILTNKNYREQLMVTVNNGLATLRQMLGDKKQILGECINYANRINPIRIDNTERLKWIILRSLKVMQSTLIDLRAKSLSYLINDYRTKKFIHALIDSEKQITLDQYIKYNALSQNVTFHSNTEYIARAIKTVDCLTKELKSKRMENSLPFIRD